MSTEALERAAVAAELAGEPQAAVAARREIVRLEPRSAAARLALARTLERTEAWREAALAYAEALRQGASAAEATLALGALHLRLAKPGLALRHLKHALAAAPQDPQVQFRTGLALHRLRRYREAIEHFGRALELRPELPELHFNLALARFEVGDLPGARAALERCRELKRGRPWNEDPVAPLAMEPAPAFDESEMSVNDVKLQHDLEQIEHLLGLGRLPAEWRGVAQEYRGLLQEVRGVTGGGIVVPFNAHRYPLVARSYKRPFQVVPDEAVPGPALNPGLNGKALENTYLSSAPHLVVVDGLLSAAALDGLRRYCRESAVWNNVQSGYLGAYLFDGFACGLLLRIAAELRERLPRVIRGLPLQMLWGYKYDHQLQGIGVHADAAAVNVNFWITEDDANLEPEGGGLLVYTHKAPADWEFERFIRDPAAIMKFLESKGAAPIRVPHRANRAVIFDSDLFHATDALRFREGYLSRRINITLLYGQRGESA